MEKNKKEDDKNINNNVEILVVLHLVYSFENILMKEGENHVHLYIVKKDY